MSGAIRFIWLRFLDIITPIIAFLIVFIIISGIWCLIYKISFNRYFITVIKPLILIFYSLAYVIFQIVQIPMIIYEFIKTVFIEIWAMLSYVINFINGISNFIYDITQINGENLF